MPGTDIKVLVIINVNRVLARPRMNCLALRLPIDDDISEPVLSGKLQIPIGIYSQFAESI